MTHNEAAQIIREKLKAAGILPETGLYNDGSIYNISKAISIQTENVMGFKDIEIVAQHGILTINTYFNLKI